MPVLDDVELGYRLKKVGKVVCSREQRYGLQQEGSERMGFGNELSWIKGDIMIITGWRYKEDYARQEY